MIRIAQEKDIARVLQLLEIVNDVHAGLFPHLFKSGKTKYNAQQLADIIAGAGDKTIFVYADENDEALAYLICEDVPAPDAENLQHVKTLYIDDICVDPAHQRKGIAKALCQHVRNFACKNGYDRITANV